MKIPDVCGRRYRVEHLAKQLQPDVGGSVRKVQRRYRHAQILPHEASRRKNCLLDKLFWGSRRGRETAISARIEFWRSKCNSFQTNVELWRTTGQYQLFSA